MCRVAGDMAQEERHGGTLANRPVRRQTGGSHLSMTNLSNGLGRGIPQPCPEPDEQEPIGVAKPQPPRGRTAQQIDPMPQRQVFGLEPFT